MLTFADAFQYTAENHSYYLMPSGFKTPNGWRLQFAEMYNTAGNFVGTWDRAQMPTKLIWALEGHLKYLSLFGGDTPHNSE
jgi:hypothetical protein